MDVVIEERLRRLAQSDAVRPDQLVERSTGALPRSGLDRRSESLVRLAALVALGASGVCFQRGVDAAFDAGATVDEVLGTMMAVASTVGLARLVSAAPRLALAAGYDVDAALERLDP